jgi:transcriptional regulator with XRE-family HTH domain
MTEKNPLGPVGHQVRQNVERLRVERRLTKKDLSDRTGAAGRTVPPLAIARIEAGTRRVDADDLSVLAMVLDVTPAMLLEEPGRPPIPRGAESPAESLVARLTEAVRDVAAPTPGADVPARARAARRLIAQLGLELDGLADNGEPMEGRSDD